MTEEQLPYPLYLEEDLRVERGYKNNVSVIFHNAIQQGKLSMDQNADNWVGNYMYMYSRPFGDLTIDHFKNRMTRAYDVTAYKKERREQK
jgi:hypothetical protein